MASVNNGAPFPSNAQERTRLVVDSQSDSLFNNGYSSFMMATMLYSQESIVMVKDGDQENTLWWYTDKWLKIINRDQQYWLINDD